MGTPSKPTQIPAVETLAATLFLAICFAVAVPLYLSRLETRSVVACRANMQTIAAAEESWRKENPGRGYTTELIDLNDHLGKLPSCPGGGIYKIRVTEKKRADVLSIHCSTPGHSQFVPGRDNR